MSTEKLTRLKHLVELANRTKVELDALDNKIQEIVTVGGEPNVIEVVKVNGSALTITDKAVDITVPEAYDDTALAGRVSAIEGDYLKAADKYDDTALAGRVSAIEADYLTSEDKYDDSELAGRVSTVEGKVTVLVGSDADKSVREIASEEVAEIVAGADESYNTLKEIADWISTHGSDAATMNSNIATLQKQLSGIGETEGAVKAYVDGAIEALSIGDYAKAADLTALAARVTTLEGQAHTHSNKDVLDGITSAKVEAWDAAEGNAKTYADGLNTAMDTRVKVLEAIDHEAYKGYADGLNSAMDARVAVLEAIDHDAYIAYVDGLIASDEEVTTALDGVFGAAE